MKMKAVSFSEASVNFYKTTWRHVPEDGSVRKTDNSAGYCKVGTLFIHLEATKLRNIPFKHTPFIVEIQYDGIVWKLN
jgi:hypothetical protein